MELVAMAYQESWSIDHHKRVKPKAHKEAKYLNWFHEVLRPPCFVCNVSVGIQAHHVKEGSSDKRNDNQIIPLCYNHHLGNEFSVHGTPREFREAYPIKEQLKHAETLYERYKDELNGYPYY